MIVLRNYDADVKAVVFTSRTHLGWLKEEHDAFGDKVRPRPCRIRKERCLNSAFVLIAWS